MRSWWAVSGSSSRSVLYAVSIRRRRRSCHGDEPSTAGGNGLALIRTDRVADALDAGLPLTAGGLTFRLTEPEIVRATPNKTVA